MLTFSIYPATLVEGTVKLLLYKLILSGFVTYLPIEALRSLALIHSVLAVAGSTTVLLVGAGVFFHSLRRYSSGNLIQMQG